MLYACVQRFDVTRNLEKFCKILGTKQTLRMSKPEAAYSMSLLAWINYWILLKLEITNNLSQETKPPWACSLGGILKEFGWFGGMLEEFMREKHCSG